MTTTAAPKRLINRACSINTLSPSFKLHVNQKRKRGRRKKISNCQCIFIKTTESHTHTKWRQERNEQNKLRKGVTRENEKNGERRKHNSWQKKDSPDGIHHAFALNAFKTFADNVELGWVDHQRNFGNIGFTINQRDATRMGKTERPAKKNSLPQTNKRTQGVHERKANARENNSTHLTIKQQKRRIAKAPSKRPSSMLISSICAPFSTCSAATFKASSYRLSMIIFLKRILPATLQRSPIFMKLVSSLTMSGSRPHKRRPWCSGWGIRGGNEDIVEAIALMCWGPVPQQPPTILINPSTAYDYMVCYPRMKERDKQANVDTWKEYNHRRPNRKKGRRRKLITQKQKMCIT